jgi:hypothetical protein
MNLGRYTNIQTIIQGDKFRQEMTVVARGGR